MGCAAAVVLLLVDVLPAQTPPAPAAPPQPEPGAAAAPAPDPRDKPGFIDAFGHWIQSSVSTWNSGLKGAADVAKDAADAASTATRGTADAVARLPGARVINERAICPTAPNGAPDCRSTAEAICKAHGFGSGSSADFQTVEKCPPVALNRPDGGPPPCVLESYVTRSLCQ